MSQAPEKAYKNLDFLNSAEARILRILAEYLEPRVRFHKQDVEDTIVFFGSARFVDRKAAQATLDKAEADLAKNASPENELAKKQAEKRLEMAGYYEDARTLARMITEWSLNEDRSAQRYLVASGGGPGIMEAANRGASEVPDGRSIGLNISIPFEQGSNPYITDELNFEFHYFFTRKFWFIYLAKAIVVFPGGFGTLDELFESMTLLQTHKIEKKMPIVLYGESYWKSVVNFDSLIENMTISARDMDLLYFANTPDAAFEYLTKVLD